MRPSPAAIVSGWITPAARLSPEWRRATLHLGVVWICLIAAFAGDWQAMAGQWWNSSTYNHIVLVPLILAWLIRLRGQEVVRIDPHPWWPGLILVAGAAFLWVLGAFSGLSTARQAGAVALLMASVPTVLGLRVTAGLLFPLGYMLFLVPFGDELIPPLQMITAAITIGLVRASGIPAAIDGVFIDTPAGLFEVAEACSGVKFLVAMITFGVLVANACFVSPLRRALFLATCVAVPVLANGIRAWGTIYIAQQTGAEVAGGFDHIVYGWLFFAVVIAAVLALAWRFFDRDPGDPVIDSGRIAASPLLAKLDRRNMAPATVMACLAAIVLAGQGWVLAAERMEAELPARIALPDVPGWHLVHYRPTVWWEPRASGARHRVIGRYEDASGRQVDVFYALYASQHEGAEAGGFGQGALPPAGHAWAWLSPGPALLGGHGDRLLAEEQVQRVAVTWYRTGDLLTGSNGRLKLAGMADRLLLRERPTGVLILSAEERPGLPAAASIAAFSRAIGPLNGWMDHMAGGR